MPHFFAVQKMPCTRLLKEPTATCSLTRWKDSPKLFAHSGSLRIMMPPTCQQDATNALKPSSVLLTDHNENALCTSKALGTKSQTSSPLPCIAGWDGPEQNPAVSTAAAPQVAAQGRLSRCCAPPAVTAGVTRERLSPVNHHFTSKTLKCLPRNKSSHIINQSDISTGIAFPAEA